MKTMGYSTNSHWARFLGITLLFVIPICAAHAADPQYKIGPATDLLDAGYYDGADQNDSGPAPSGRMAFYGVASNDGLSVAFIAYDIQSGLFALYVVDMGDPSSWQRITGDGISAGPVTWSPDGSCVFVEGWRISIGTGEIHQHWIHGQNPSTACVTRKPSGNWMFTYVAPERADGDLVALPILSNGDEDPSRQLVVITDLKPSGPEPAWPHVTADGTMVAFENYRGLGPAPDPLHDVTNIHVITGVTEILSASKRPGTDISTLAPTSLSDPKIVTIEDGLNGAIAPRFAEDKSLVLYSEDWAQKFVGSDWYQTLPLSNFDVMVRRSDGTAPAFRIDEPLNQFFTIPTPGGTRLTYNNDVSGIVHLFISTLEVVTTVTGDPVGDPEDNDVLTTTEIQASDASGTDVVIPDNVVIDFPVGEPQEIQITTPIDPATTPQLPPGIAAVPVIREFGPAGTTFSQPITITITYTDAEVDGYAEEWLRVFMYNASTGKYDLEVTDIVGRDLVNNTISFRVSHFSTYGLAAVSETTVPLHVSVLTMAILFTLGVAWALRRNRAQAEG